MALKRVKKFIKRVRGKSSFKAEAPEAQAAQFGGSDQERQAFRNFFVGEGVRSRTQMAGGADFQRALDNRAQQGEAIGLARSAALGQTASPAELQQRAAFERAQRGQFALAAGARGGGAQAALRQAQSNAGQLQAQAAQEAAVLRAQEQQAARGQFLDALLAQRGQDFQAAGLAQQQQGLNQQRERDFLNALLTSEGAQLSAQQQVALANQNAALQAQGINAGVSQGNAQRNQTAALGFINMLASGGAQIASGGASGGGGMSGGGGGGGGGGWPGSNYG